MRTIELTQGKFALVDDELFEELSRYEWHAAKAAGGHWYAGRKIRANGKRVLILMHRQIMAAPDRLVVDHLNRNGLDNQRANLRVCTPWENSGNTKLGRRNKTGEKGVYWNSKKQKYHAQVRAEDGKRYHLGYFDSLDEAAKAYKAAAQRLFSLPSTP